MTSGRRRRAHRTRSPRHGADRCRAGTTVDHSRRGHRAIAAHGRRVSAWRGVPVLPCDKLPISRAGTISILALRLGVDHEGVIGLRHAGLLDEVEPGLSVRRMTINGQAISSYRVSAYFSVAVLVPDALGVLEDVEREP